MMHLIDLGKTFWSNHVELKIFASEIKSDDMFIINNEITKSSSIESIKDLIIGHQTIDTRIIKDGALFRTFILVRYPIKN